MLILSFQLTNMSFLLEGVSLLFQTSLYPVDSSEGVSSLETVSVSKNMVYQRSKLDTGTLLTLVMGSIAKFNIERCMLC